MQIVRVEEMMGCAVLYWAWRTAPSNILLQSIIIKRHAAPLHATVHHFIDTISKEQVDFFAKQNKKKKKAYFGVVISSKLLNNVSDSENSSKVFMQLLL